MYRNVVSIPLSIPVIFTLMAARTKEHEERLARSEKRLIHGYYQFGCWQNGQGDRLIPAEDHSVWGVYHPQMMHSNYRQENQDILVEFLTDTLFALESCNY